MTRRRVLWIVAYFTATAVLIGGLVVFVRAREDRSAAAAPSVDPVPAAALVAQPFPVSLSTAGHRSLTAGSGIAVGVQAVTGHQVKTIELWDGAEKVSSQSPAPDHHGASFTWPALAPGPHLLTARVVDDQGEQADAPPVQIDVIPAPITAGTATVALPMQAADTPALVAARYGIDPSLLVLTPPGAPPEKGSDHAGQAMVAGTTIFASAAPAMRPELDGKVAVISAGDPATATITPPAASVTVTADGCNVAVTAHQKQLRIEVGSSGQFGFTGTGAPLADGESRTFENLPVGTYVYRGSWAEGPTTLHTYPVSVTIPKGCAAATGWTGDAFISKGILYLPKAVGQIYVYLGKDHDAFQRIPRDETRFLDGSTAEVDISHEMPYLGRATTLQIEVWQKGVPIKGAAGATLVATGAATLSQPNSPAATLIGEGSALDVVAGDGLVPSEAHRDVTLGDPEDVALTWLSSAPQADHVVWQVLAVPLTPANTDLVPIGTLEVGRSAVGLTGAETDWYRHGAYFTADTRTIAKSYDSDPGQAGSLGTPPALPPESDPAPAKASSTIDASSLLTGLSPTASGIVYVRAVAMGHDPATNTEINLGVASEVVPITLPPPPTPKAGAGIKLTSVALYPGSVPSAGNPGTVDCARVLHAAWFGNVPPSANTVTSYGWGSSTSPNPLVSGYSTYPVAATYCLTDPEFHPSCNILCKIASDIGKAIEDVVDIAAAVWDFIAAAYNGIIDDIAGLVAEFDPVCFALKAASKSAGKSCTEVTDIVAHAAIAAVLTSFGLPPSLPTSKEIGAVARGDLTQIAVEYLKELGIPCDDLKSSPEVAQAVTDGAKQAGIDIPGGADDPCTALVNYVIDKVKAEVTKQTSQSTASALGLPDYSYIDDTFSMIPEPDSHLSSFEIAITAENDGDPAPGAPCPVLVNAKDSSGHYVFNTALATLHGPPDGTGRWDGVVTLVPTVNSRSDNLPVGEPITVDVSSAGCGTFPAAGVSFTTPLGPPLVPIQLNEALAAAGDGGPEHVGTQAGG